MKLTGFQHEILRAIQADLPLPPKRFDSLAMETFAWQYRNNSVYRRWVSRYGNPKPSNTTQITPLPVTVFKFALVRAARPPRPAAVFETSGTTRGQKRGRHFYPDLSFYDAVIDALFGRWVMAGERRIRIASFLASSRENPRSSLSYMADRAARRFAKGPVCRGIRGGEIRFRELARFLREAVDRREPVLILSTTLGLWAYLDILRRSRLRFDLPEGSRIMETGGMKGRRHEIPRSLLLRRVRECLGVSANRVINEYGMTELTTHFYDGVLRGGPAGRKQIPSWASVTVAASPFVPAAGRTGLLRLTDLANQWSVAFVQTEDRARIVGRSFEVLGRDPGADLRGCSLDYEKEPL